MLKNWLIVINFAYSCTCILKPFIIFFYFSLYECPFKQMKQNQFYVNHTRTQIQNMWHTQPKDNSSSRKSDILIPEHWWALKYSWVHSWDYKMTAVTDQPLRRTANFGPLYSSRNCWYFIYIFHLPKSLVSLSHIINWGLLNFMAIYK